MQTFFVNSGRIFALAGEYAPLRYAVPSTWLDDFEKTKARSFNSVSFYVL